MEGQWDSLTKANVLQMYVEWYFRENLVHRYFLFDSAKQKRNSRNEMVTEICSYSYKMNVVFYDTNNLSISKSVNFLSFWVFWISLKPLYIIRWDNPYAIFECVLKLCMHRPHLFLVNLQSREGGASLVFSDTSSMGLV